MKVRRVVTGIGDDGKSVFVEDVTLDAPAMPGLGEVATAWAADEPARYPEGPFRNPEAEAFFPPVGGIRCLIGSLAPDGAQDSDQAAHSSAGDVAAAMEDGVAGMHATDTTDFTVILTGRCIIELDDGAEAELGPGDLLVQNGTRHKWRNPYDERTTLAIFMIGAHRT